MPTSQYKRFRVSATRLTPLVVYRPGQNYFKMEGRSSPHYAVDFYRPIINALRKYPPANRKLIAEFSLEYFNTSSSKCIYDVFRVLDDFRKKGMNIQVNWHYHEWDDDMLETGEDYQVTTGLDFHFQSHYAS